MSPRGRVTIHVGSDGGSDGGGVDPVTLGNYFWYASLGVYGLYFFYIIMVVLAQKRHYPYLFMYAIITSAMISTLLTVVSIVAPFGGGYIDLAASIYFYFFIYLTWAFLFEPSRQINLIQRRNNNNNNDRPWHLSQYTSSAAGIAVLIGYILIICFTLLIIAFYVAAYYSDSMDIATRNGLFLFIVFSSLIFPLIWFFLAVSHWQHIGEKRSYCLYGFFALLMEIGMILENVPGVLSVDYGVYGPVLLNFLLVQCCHFIAIFFGIIHGSKWIKHDMIIHQK
ncbi:uncharacterized protein BX664DRAFT_326566 [Halteromyces radiatus]|uniref:uncharacterized protein n=1 Tax=Halteromyces radiatus TaxID=101107 RepID=UPI00221F5A98|nr:uncharacterized protein BX664DRAFT_326566 [Halteromyces radiatus]KAI8097504.1 hypothetical protein BX664DRAFT_326566 [Halteromyces radiatus]